MEKAELNEMGSACITFSADIIGEEPRQLLELVALPSEQKHASKRLSASTNDLLHAVVGVIDQIVLRAMRERTAQGFDKTAREAFTSYFAAMVALGALIKITVPERDIDWLAAQSLTELESDFKNLGADKFGSELRDRGLFTVWTLRKIHDLRGELKNAELGDNAKQFAMHAVWARFHIDILVKSMKSDMAIFPDVVDRIADGLRAAVNAYAWLRQEVDRISGISEPELKPIAWDDEDEILLSDSMENLGREKC